MKVSIKKASVSLKHMLSAHHIVLLWCHNSECKRNWGDALNVSLIKHLSGKKIINSSEIYKTTGVKVYSVIGSVLDNLSTPNVHIWGSGILDSESRIIVPPKRVYAVRGPKTREHLLKHGISCPEIYGDPALLFPRFYNPQIDKKYELGIVPHLREKNTAELNVFRNMPGVCIVDVESGVRAFVDALKSCKHIASSSLHGLIAADAYNIPSVWIKLTDRLNGNGIKFIDYFTSQQSAIHTPLTLLDDNSIQRLLDHMHYPLKNINAEKLVEVCPFKRIHVERPY